MVIRISFKVFVSSAFLRANSFGDFPWDDDGSESKSGFLLSVNATVKQKQTQAWAYFTAQFQPCIYSVMYVAKGNIKS